MNALVINRPEKNPIPDKVISGALEIYLDNSNGKIYFSNSTNDKKIEFNINDLSSNMSLEDMVVNSMVIRDMKVNKIFMQTVNNWMEVAEADEKISIVFKGEEIIYIDENDLYINGTAINENITEILNNINNMDWENYKITIDNNKTKLDTIDWTSYKTIIDNNKTKLDTIDWTTYKNIIDNNKTKLDTIDWTTYKNIIDNLQITVTTQSEDTTTDDQVSINTENINGILTAMLTSTNVLTIVNNAISEIIFPTYDDTEIITAINNCPTTTEMNTAIDSINIPTYDISGIATNTAAIELLPTTEYVDTAINNIIFPTYDDSEIITAINALPTTEYVDNAISEIIIPTYDISGIATNTAAIELLPTKNYINNVLKDYLTLDQINQAIALYRKISEGKYATIENLNLCPTTVEMNAAITALIDDTIDPNYQTISDKVADNEADIIALFKDKVNYPTKIAMDTAIFKAAYDDSALTSAISLCPTTTEMNTAISNIVIPTYDISGISTNTTAINSNANNITSIKNIVNTSNPSINVQLGSKYCHMHPNYTNPEVKAQKSGWNYALMAARDDGGTLEIGRSWGSSHVIWQMRCEDDYRMRFSFYKPYDNWYDKCYINGNASNGSLNFTGAHTCYPETLQLEIGQCVYMTGKIKSLEELSTWEALPIVTNNGIAKKFYGIYLEYIDGDRVVFQQGAFCNEVEKTDERIWIGAHGNMQGLAYPDTYEAGDYLIPDGKYLRKSEIPNVPLIRCLEDITITSVSKLAIEL